MQPLTYVISDTDPSSPNYKISRRNLDRTLAQAAQFKWSVTVWPATNGRTLTDQDWQTIGVELLNRGAIVKRPGARGCWHSHWRLWSHCVNIDQPIVILEHDAFITAPWPKTIDLNHCVWKLHGPDGRGERTNTITGEWSCGAWAYTMTPYFARKLIEFSRTHGAQAVDKQLGRSVIPWQYWHDDLVIHKPSVRISTTSGKIPDRI
jgi:GR25 family glycosyltransferase involved in LPS biosynthesis